MQNSKEDTKNYDHMSCPHCNHHGCFSYFSWDEGTKCYSCGKQTWKQFKMNDTKTGVIMKEDTTMTPEALSNTNVESIDGKLYAWGKLETITAPLYSRRITKETCEHYNVRSDINESGDVVKVRFPYNDFEGTQIATKHNVPATETQKKKMWTEGNMTDAVLFGQSKFPRGVSKFVTITEGELDALSAFQMLGSTFPCVSLKLGAGSVLKCFEDVKVYDWVNSFNKIVISFDDDEAGREATKVITGLFPPEKIHVMPMSYKDANEYLTKGEEDRFKKDWWSAKPAVLEGIVNLSESRDHALKPANVQKINYPWKKTNELTRGIRMGEATTVLAGCVDADTEFLTPTGWVRMDEYEEGMLVAQYNKGTKAVSYVIPTEYIKKPCTEMWHIETKYGVNQMLTDEHRVLFDTESGITDVRTLFEVRQEHETNSTGFRGRIRTSFTSDDKIGYKISDADIRVMTAVIADGHFPAKLKTNHCVIRIKKERKKIRLRRLLAEAGIEYVEKECAPYEGFARFSFKAPWKTKVFDEAFWGMNDSQRRVFCDEVLFWDGNQDSQFYSRVKDNADFVQYAFSSMGYRAAINESVRDDGIDYVVHVTDRGLVSFRKGTGVKPKFEKVIPKDGFKYCFSVPDTFLVLRRGGDVFVTGNTGVGKTSIMQELVVHILDTTEYKIGCMFIENSERDTVNNIVGTAMSYPLKFALENDEELASHKFEYDSKHGHGAFERDREAAMKRTVDSGRLWSIADTDYTVNNIEKTLARCRYFAKVLGCKVIFLDHISLLVSGGEHDGDERKALDEIATKLAMIVKELGIHLFLVTQANTPSGKALEEGGHTSINGVRGTRGVGHITHNMLGIERNGQSEEERVRNTTILRVLKCRWTGRTGPSSSLLFSHETYRMTEIFPEDPQLNVSEEPQPDIDLNEFHKIV